MLNAIKDNYNFNKILSIGEDKRFHTVYVILFETGHYYIGKHTSNNLKTDNYFASGVLPNLYKKKDIKYKRNILFYFNSSKEAIEAETDILSNKKIYDNELCLNCYPGSPPDATGTIIISLENKFKMIHPKFLEYYLELGWERKGVKRVFVSKGNEVKYILPEEVENHLNDNWFLGNVKSRNRNFIIKNNVLKFIPKDQLQRYIDNGWTKKHNVEGYKVLRKENELIKVPEKDLQQYLNKGYRQSSTVENLIYIKKDRELKRVTPEDLNSYLSQGWIKGGNKSGQTYITNGIQECRIFKEDLHLYPGWNFGRLAKIRINNGEVEKRVREDYQELLKQYLLDGYVLGPLKREKKILLYKINAKKYVYPRDLKTALEEGWTDIYNPSIHFSARNKSSHYKKFPTYTDK